MTSSERDECSGDREASVYQAFRLFLDICGPRKESVLLTKTHPLSPCEFYWIGSGL